MYRHMRLRSDHSFQKYPFIFLGFFATIVIVVFAFRIAFSPCIDVVVGDSIPGSQGYRVWFGETLQTFEHSNRKVCVPEGWESVGQIREGNGWVRFESGRTGVLIRPDAFFEKTITLQTSSYVLRVLFPITTADADVVEYLQTIEAIFNRAGALFGDEAIGKAKTHTVLVTAELDVFFDEGEAVYPDPRENLTVFVRKPADIRGEELFIHAVMHLYNRFNTEFVTYQKTQKPFGREDMQELEATWAETAFRSSERGREQRVSYLYTVHRAVQERRFDLISEPPFNNESLFDTIVPNVLVESETSDINIQYGHYVLGPLAMVAIDGLLQEQNAPVDVETILTRLHTGAARNFLDEVSRYITPEQKNEVVKWMMSGVTIPTHPIQSALNYYNR